MDRRKFLQNMFGAAVIAAMPKIVIEQISALPEPPLVSPAINGATTIFTRKISAPDGLLYIWDDIENILIGVCNKFSLEIKRPFIEINDLSSLYPQYFPGPQSWNVSASNVQWVNDPRELFEENRKLRCLIAKDDIRIDGEIYISGLEITAPDFEGLSSSAIFEGNGALIIEKYEDNTAIEDSIRTIKGSADSNRNILDQSPRKIAGK